MGDKGRDMRRGMIVAFVLVLGAAGLAWWLAGRGGAGGVVPATGGVGMTTAGGASERQLTADEALAGLFAGSVDGHDDHELVRGLLMALPTEARAGWWERLLAGLSRMDLAQTGELRRQIALIALEDGALDAAWAMLWPLTDCTGCTAHDRLDALRLLDQYFPDAEPRRAKLTARTEAAARAILSEPEPRDAHVPLVWSAYQRARREGRLDGAIELQRGELVTRGRFMDSARTRILQQNLAQDLMSAGRDDEALPLWMEVAEAYRRQEAGEGVGFSVERASVLVHASGAMAVSDGVSLLLGTLGGPGLEGRPAAAVLGLNLLLLQQRAGRPELAMAAAVRTWELLRNGGGGAAALGERTSAESAAMVCFRASELARAAGRQEEARLWLDRLLELAPGTVTAQSVREARARQGRP